MANILILGAGSMGSAFSFPCSENKHKVSVVGTHLEDDFIEKINSNKKHPALNCELPKSVKFLKFKNLKNEINKKIDLVVIAVISKGIEWAANELGKIINEDSQILILTKGLAVRNNKYEILAHKMERILKEKGIKKINITAAGGPCLAKGLANKVHTSVIFANKDINVAKDIAKLVSTEYYHVSTTDDVIGVEVCAAIKNIFSMAIGAAQGLCHPDAAKEIREKNYLNTSAALINESISEMITFTENLNGKKETVLGLAGIGDLYVSADGGRNSKMGEYLGQRMSFKEAKKIKMPNITVEGADLALEIGLKVKKDFDEKTLPLMISMINTICEQKTLKFDWKNFR